jgi:hypothetical protein
MKSQQAFLKALQLMCMHVQVLLQPPPAQHEAAWNSKRSFGREPGKIVQRKRTNKAPAVICLIPLIMQLCAQCLLGYAVCHLALLKGVLQALQGSLAL